jgi:hypothetical protein
MLAGRFKYDRAAPIFDCKINGNAVTLDDISHSYPMMISEWLYGDKNKLWNLHQAAAGIGQVRYADLISASPNSGVIDFRPNRPMGWEVTD